MKYKLLVLDVDGTLLNNEKEISKRTLASLLKVQQMGTRIALASGRPTYGLMPLAKILELGNYGGFIVSYNGCHIFFCRYFLLYILYKIIYFNFNSFINFI